MTQVCVFSLSIANASFRRNVPAKDEFETDNNDHQFSTLTINADFQDVSSHMNPDIADIIGLRVQHVDILESMLSCELIALPQTNKYEGTALSDIGVPLLLPLTVGIEFEQIVTSRGPKQRFLSISVDPLSVMLSNEDLQLVRAVTEAWTSTTKASKTPGNTLPYLYDAVFIFERLGLGLRKENGRIVVDNIADSVAHDNILTGDSLHAIVLGFVWHSVRYSEPKSQS